MRRTRKGLSVAKGPLSSAPATVEVTSDLCDAAQTAANISAHMSHFLAPHCHLGHCTAIGPRKIWLWID